MTNFLSQFSNNDFSKAMESNAKLMNFTPSDQTLIDLKNFSFTYKQNLMFINTAIIKVMIIKEYPPNKIKDIIDSENFICNEEDLNSFIISGDSNKSAKIALAYMHEKNKNYDQALSIWREFGIKREEEPVLSHEACERTKLIFTITKDKDLFKEYIGWMLEKYTESGFKIFVKLEIIQIEFFYTSIIGQVDKANPSLNLKERFLEFYIDSGCNNERYHTMICDLYLEKLFKFKKQNESLENSDIYKLEPLVKVVYDKFNAVIKNSKYYNKAHILDKIKDSWMTDIEIYLYSQLNMHESAISKLIIIGCGEENFDKVEKYCHETSSNTSNSHAGKELYGEMFKVLTNEYQKSIKGYANCKSEKEKNSASKCAELLKKQMYNVLKKYGDSQKLDVFQVLELIPSDWLLTDQILYDYLVKVIKNSNHMSNKYKLAKSLSEMSLLYKEKELIEVKSKSVQIGNDTNCESCKKKIGTTIFVVYPNMKIYHTKCTQNFNICPTTRVDFSKKKYA